MPSAEEIAQWLEAPLTGAESEALAWYEKKRSEIEILFLAVLNRLKVDGVHEPVSLCTPDGTRLWTSDGNGRWITSVIE